MKAFWRFMKMTFHYKWLLAIAFVGIAIDTFCFFGGFASLTWAVGLLLNKEDSVHDIIAGRLRSILEKDWFSPSVAQWLEVNLLSWVEMIPDDRFEASVVILIMIFVFTIVGSVGRFIHEYMTMTVGFRTIMRIRKEIFQRLVHVPLNAIHKDSIGNRLVRIVSDSGMVAGGFSLLTGRALRDLLQGMVLLFWAFVIDWKLSAIFLIGAPFIGILLKVFASRIRHATKAALREYGNLTTALTESLQALRIVKVYQAEGYERRRFNLINRNLYKEQMRARVAKALSSPVIEGIAISGVIVVCMLASYYVFRFGQKPDSLVLVLMSLIAAASALRPLTKLNNDMQESFAAAERIMEMLNCEVEENHRENRDYQSQRLPRHRESVRFENVTFTYPATSEPVLRDITLNVKFGAVCAIVGSNGSGKTTLLSLLPRLYRPDSGTVRIDGIDIGKVSLRSLRRQFAVVTQDAILFRGTIEDNIRYGSRHVSHEQVVDAAKRAHAHEFIEATQDGYQTNVGELGGRLSGGQRQRIAIARAILRNPAILILDEATSQIDSESEVKINAALRDIRQDRTCFVIAHRLSTVADADMIVVLNRGRIEAIGTHLDLLETSPTYQVLCQTQFGAAE